MKNRHRRKPPFRAGLTYRVSSTLNSRGQRQTFESSNDPGALDEVVIDDWYHLEMMSEGRWYMRIGDLRFSIVVDERGRATLFDKDLP